MSDTLPAFDHRLGPAKERRLCIPADLAQGEWRQFFYVRKRHVSSLQVIDLDGLSVERCGQDHPES